MVNVTIKEAEVKKRNIEVFDCFKNTDSNSIYVVFFSSSGFPYLFNMNSGSVWDECKCDPFAGYEEDFVYLGKLTDITVTR